MTASGSDRRIPTGSGCRRRWLCMLGGTPPRDPQASAVLPDVGAMRHHLGGGRARHITGQQFSTARETQHD